MRGDPDITIEPVKGLPAALPPGERIVWQGQPSAWGLARHAFLARAVGIYFAIIALWYGVDAIVMGGTLLTAIRDAGPVVITGIAAVAVLYLLGRMQARAAVYTLTNKRLVLRIGVATTATINLPLSQVVSAELCQREGGRGDIPLTITFEGKRRPLPYLLLWPHVRPWHMRLPQPMLRAVPQVEKVARLLVETLGTEVAQQPVPVAGQKESVNQTGQTVVAAE